MSRKPQPTALKAVKGERKDRLNTEEPVPAAGEVASPTNLSDGARAVWERLAPDLTAQGVLTPWDVDEFAAFCDAVDRRDRAAEAMDRDGEVVESPVFDRNGNLSGHRLDRSPWWVVWKGANEIMLRYGARFGLSPSERASLKVGASDGAAQQGAGRLLSG